MVRRLLTNLKQKNHKKKRSKLKNNNFNSKYSLKKKQINQKNQKNLKNSKVVLINQEKVEFVK